MGIPQLKFSRRIISFSGLIIVGIGIYFIFFRPIFLPEDLNFLGMGQSPAELIPHLAIWLKRVFTVLGGFMISTGILTLVSSYRLNIWVQFTIWATSIGLMTVVNFAINSAFKWALLILAVFWLSGIVLGWPRTKLKA